MTGAALVVNSDRLIAATVADELALAGRTVVGIVLEGRRSRARAKAAGPTPGGFDLVGELVDLLAAVFDELGPVDTLVYDANQVPTAGASSDGAVGGVVDTLMTTIALTGAHMEANGGGSITVVCPTPSGEAADHIGYVIAKSAVISCASSLAEEWAGRGVRINSLAPGLVDGDHRFTEGAQKWGQVMEGLVPLKRRATSREVAKAVLFLASDRASYMSGTVLNVDGGLTASSGGDFFPQRGVRVGRRQRL